MNKKVVLIHGYFRTHKDMLNLKKSLEKLGYEVITVDLPLTFSKIDYGLQVFNEKMNKIIQSLNGNEKVNLVGHSTGGLIIRMYLNNTRNSNRIHKCVLIATPNKGSFLAELASFIPGYTSVFRTLKSLSSEGVRKLDLSPIHNIEIGVIAGNKNNMLLGKIFKNESDGRVEVESAKYVDSKDCIVIPYNHKEIHHTNKTAELIDKFLIKGFF